MSASPAPPQLLLATRNPDKQRKLLWVVAGLPFAVHFPPSGAQPPETGQSHRDNAVQKALWWSERVAGLVLASDGGVHIPALGEGWRSVQTRRGSGARSDAERTADLLARLEGREGAARTAVWREALALAEAGRLIGAWEAEGPPLRIAARPGGTRPEGGFWLDRLLADPASGRTLAELSPAELRRLDRAWRILRVCARRRLLHWQAEQG